MKLPLLLTPSSSPPPHQLGWKIGKGLGRDDSICCSVQWVWITLGRVLRVGNAMGATFNHLAPLRNLMTKSCFPTDLPFTESRCAAIVATLRVEGDSRRSNPSCKKKSTILIGHLRGSSWWEEHHSTNSFHFGL